jgi:Uma2 family endonuclease
MAMPARATEWTVDVLDALPDDGNRYELIDGELFVTPAPSDVHQLIAGELNSRLLQYLRASTVGRSIVSPADVRKPDRKCNRVQPDVFVVRLTDGKRPTYPFDLSDLLLAVEVQSPSNPAYDYQVKRELYLNNGVPEYWIVNADSRNVVRWRGTADPGEILSMRLEWQPSGMGTAFVLELAEFFETALS